MELHTISRDTIWNVLQNASHSSLFNRYLIATANTITSSMPGLKERVLPLSWVLNPEDHGQELSTVAFTSDEGWYCEVIGGTFSLHLTTRWYTECGLQCSKSRDTPKSRDPREWYVFTFDLTRGRPSSSVLSRLKYCFTHVLNHEYTWFFGEKCGVPAAPAKLSIPNLSVDVDVTMIADVIGAQILDIASSDSPNNVVNSFTYPEIANTPHEFHVYTTETVARVTDVIEALSPSERQSIKFLYFSGLPTHLHNNRDVAVYFDADKVYLLQYDVRAMVEFSNSRGLTTKAVLQSNLVSLLAARSQAHLPAASFLHTIRSNLTLSLGISELTTLTPASKHATLCMDVDKTSSYLLGGDKKGSIAIYDIQKGDEHALTQYQAICTSNSSTQTNHKFSVSAVSWYPTDNAIFVTGSYDRTVKVWDTNDMTPVETFSVDTVNDVAMSGKRPRKSASSASSSLTTSLIAVALSTNVVKLCDMNTGAASHILRGHEGPVTAVTWSKRNAHALFSAGRDGKIIAYDIRRSTPAIHFFDHANRARHEKAHTGMVTSLNQSECGLYLVSSGTDRQIRLWDTNTGLNTMTNFAPIQAEEIHHVTATLTEGSCYPGLLYLPTGHDISVYDSLSGTHLTDLSGHFGRVTSVQFVKDSLQMISASHDSTIQVWEPTWGEEDSNAITDAIYRDTWSSDEDDVT